VHQRLGGGDGGRIVETTGEQVNGVPNAAIENQAVKHRQQRHGDTARQSALHSGGDGIDLQWKPGALDLQCNGEVHHLGSRSRHQLCPSSDGNFHVMLVRQHLAKPSNCAEEIEDRSENADRRIGE